MKGRVRMETVETGLVRGVAGCRMTDHKRNEDISGELGVTDICTIIKYRLQHLEIMSENRIPNLVF
jgi:hypothetical protein